ncbi:MAG TPA: phosphatase PAP2 family protein [Longimicrobium sp.]|uniref:phosphatase PAP2 family protein n=1 Tax=Longimicrobium sp. TaxID=2029185 RepID=UPI002ED800E0
MPQKSDPPRHRIRPGRWLLVEGPRLAMLRGHDAWKQLPRQAPRTWLRWMAGGLALCLALVLALDLWVSRLQSSGRLAWEADWLRWFEGAGPSFAHAVWMDSLGNSVVLIPLILGTALLAGWLHRPLRALTVLACYFGVDLIVGLGWMMWNRQRPDLIAGGIAAPALHSFPSGHMAQVVAAFGLWAWLWMRATPSRSERVLASLTVPMAWAIVAAARLRLGAHWPTDILAGTAVGAAWLAVCIASLRRAESRGGR